jgi:hypothetical protein
MRTFSPPSGAYRASLDSSAPTASERPPATSAWATTIISQQPRTAILRSAKPADARTRFELARDLQRELKRAGCYGGEINGLWNPSTRRAMSAFMDRANAKLPIKSPDYILLSLVENHGEISCAAGCAGGEMTDESGRCVPNSVIAQSSKRTKQLETHRIAQPRGAASLARVAVARKEPLPWLDRDGRSIVAETSPRPAAPPGMMAIGGPVAGTAPAAIAPPSRKVVIESDGGTIAEAASLPNTDVAALATGDDDASISESAPAAKPVKYRRARHAREWRGERPRASGHSKRTRRGDPRPGTMRYNVAQVLGGIY